MAKSQRLALVTGASSGIGREFARILAQRGHALLLVARSESRLTELASELRTAHGVEVKTLAVDLAVLGAAQRVFNYTTREGLEVDILVNNAGVGHYGEHNDIAIEQLESMLLLNVVTLTELCRFYADGMKERGHGQILNVASTAAYQPTPSFAAYGASKSFVLNFSEALAMELVDHGVTVSCLAPGPTDTGFFSEMDAKGVHNAHFAQRHDARAVAQEGIDMLMAGQLSRIVGTANNLRAFGLRFAPRRMVAAIAKNLMRANAAAHAV